MVPALGDVYDTRDQSLTPTAFGDTVQPLEDRDEYNRAISVIKYYQSANDPNSKAVMDRSAFKKELEELLAKWEIKG